PALHKLHRHGQRNACNVGVVSHARDQRLWTKHGVMSHCSFWRPLHGSAVCEERACFVGFCLVLVEHALEVDPVACPGGTSEDDQAASMTHAVHAPVPPTTTVFVAPHFRSCCSISAGSSDWGMSTR